MLLSGKKMLNFKAKLLITSNNRLPTAGGAVRQAAEGAPGSSTPSPGWLILSGAYFPDLKALHKVPTSAAVFRWLRSPPLPAAPLTRRPSASLDSSLTGNLPGTRDRRGGQAGGEVLLSGLESEFCKMRRVLRMEVVKAAEQGERTDCPLRNGFGC